MLNFNIELVFILKTVDGGSGFKRKRSIIDVKTIEVSVILNGAQKASQLVTIEIPETNIKANFTTDSKGKAKTTITAKNLKLWSPEILIYMRLS